MKEWKKLIMMNKKEAIFIKDNENLFNIKVKDKMEIHVLNAVENIEIATLSCKNYYKRNYRLV